jgi:hypothetical protein
MALSAPRARIRRWLMLLLLPGLLAPAASDEQVAPYERQLQLLRASTHVLPPRLPRVELFAMYNREAPVPPQCYTRTQQQHNPCYVCHQAPRSGRENVMDDGNLQAEYAFSDEGRRNHWLNLFRDRSAQVAQITDDEILDWIDDDNYSALAARLKQAGFKGWIPDLSGLQDGAAAFDSQGFARDGSGWVAFRYKPLPSTFWPTNGSTDDVMIRLPESFQHDSAGRPSRDVYLANLTLLEMAIKGQREMRSPAIDERAAGADLDGDGNLASATRVKARQHYVGGASGIIVKAHIYPLNTEFLHSVRYVGVAADGSTGPSRRMKELRYMRRWLDSDAGQLRRGYEMENAEKERGELPAFVNMGQGGLASPMGWQLSGFIEGPDGRLRADTFEETMYCMGCHTTIGSTIDKTFSFARKQDGAAGWRYIDLHGMPDAPSMGEVLGEIATYLVRTGGGSEFRANEEMRRRWFREDGSVDLAAVAKAPDVYALVAPSRERALLLDKAYRVLVAEQSYVYGRDPTVTPPQQVYEQVDENTPTLPQDRRYTWDIRLDWLDAEGKGRRAQ